MTLIDKIKAGVYVIAEMSANHNGELKRALDIVHAAKESGADCVKIQTYTADSMTIKCKNDYFKISGGLWDGYYLYDLYKEASTPYEWQDAIKNECERIGIDFLSTPFDKHSADFLEDMGVGAYKIASFELVDIPLIKHIAKKGKPMIVSCGMGSLEEISDAVDAMVDESLPRENIVLLKCTSEYPAEVSDMNLSTIADMKNRFGVNVGLSDHSLSIVPPISAVALGARVIEKHFCLSRADGGVDSAFSLEPGEFKEMVLAVRSGYEANGKINYGVTGKEKNSLVFRRSVFAIKNINKGELFSEKNIRVIRPGYGAKPKHFVTLLDMRSDRDYLEGEPIMYTQDSESGF